MEKPRRAVNTQSGLRDKRRVEYHSVEDSNIPDLRKFDGEVAQKHKLGAIPLLAQCRYFALKQNVSFDGDWN